MPSKKEQTTSTSKVERPVDTEIWCNVPEEERKVTYEGTIRGQMIGKIRHYDSKTKQMCISEFKQEVEEDEKEK